MDLFGIRLATTTPLDGSQRIRTHPSQHRLHKHQSGQEYKIRLVGHAHLIAIMGSGYSKILWILGKPDADAKIAHLSRDSPPNAHR